MGIGRKWESGQAEAERKLVLSLDDIEVKHGGVKGLARHEQRKEIESKKDPYGEETKILHKKDARPVNWERHVTFAGEKEKRETQQRPKREKSSLEEEDAKVVLERPKACSEGKDFVAGNCQEVIRPDSKGGNTYVNIWEQKEGQRNERTPKRIKVQIGSLTCGDTVRFLEAEKARVMGEIREEQERRQQCGRDTKVPSGTRGKQCHDADSTKGKDWEPNGGNQMEPEGRAWGPMEEALDKPEERAAEIKGKQRTEPDETCPQDLKSPLISEGKIRQRGDTERRAADENKVQLEAKATPAAGQQQGEKPAGVMRGGQVKATREQTDSRGPQRVSTRPPFEITRKIERRAMGNSSLRSSTPSGRRAIGLSTLRSCTPIERRAMESPTLRSCTPIERRTTESSALRSSIPVERRATESSALRSCTPVERRAMESSAQRSCTPNPRDSKSTKFAVTRAEADRGRGRGVTQQGNREEEEKELQKKAIFHLEALRRIEERYNRRVSIVTRNQNETPRYHTAHNINNRSMAVHEIQQFRKLQQRGKGGLNDLLAPVFEDELKRRFQDSEENSPTDSEADRQVATFQRMKKAQLRAAEKQIAVAKTRGQQIRAQLKGMPARVQSVQRARPQETPIDRREATIGRECLRPQTNHFPAGQGEGRLIPYTPSAKRIREENEKARAAAELERERCRRAKLKEEVRRVRSRSAGSASESAELYGRLNRDVRRNKLGPTIGLKVTPSSPQDLNGYSRFKRLEMTPQRARNKFRSPFASPRKTMQANALEHFANWEKELRSAQRSKSQGKQRSRDRRVTILEAPKRGSRRSESPAFLRLSNRSSPRNQSPVTIMPDPIPDHYGTMQTGCRCEGRPKREGKEKNRMKAVDARMKVVDARVTESPRGAPRRENCQSLNWLGKLYNTITSFS